MGHASDTVDHPEQALLHCKNGQADADSKKHPDIPFELPFAGVKQSSATTMCDPDLVTNEEGPVAHKTQRQPRTNLTPTGAHGPVTFSPSPSSNTETLSAPFAALARARAPPHPH